jgi:hypothetical protein
MPFLGLAWGLISKVGSKVWIGLAIVIGVLLLLAGVKNAGRLIERAERQGHELEIKNAQLREAARRARNRGDLVGRMRDRSF